ncbi:MAG TPA: glycine cleavage T C-terminal barrel domain-containing protein, partial [Casimicrobiaceae bacterium]|nr:glycine cleavage T C-terminal barrel domain-containing protein [Casimicrobiaceae bacterium]
AGAALGLRDAGYYTIDALRIEAGRRAWGAELGPDETPFEAGLAYAVRLDKPAPFIGRDALIRQQAEGLRKRLVRFAFDDPAAFPWGGEPIQMDGRNVGELSSAGYSRKHGRALAMGYARSDRVLTDADLIAATYRVDIAGETFAVTPQL